MVPSDRTGMTLRVAEFRAMSERLKEDSKKIHDDPLSLALHLERLSLPVLDELARMLCSDRTGSLNLTYEIRELVIALRELLFENVD